MNRPDDGGSKRLSVYFKDTTRHHIPGYHLI
jgi:hypothetical protein